MNKIFFATLLLAFSLVACKSDTTTSSNNASNSYTGLTATRASQTISVDGLIDKAWDNAPWHKIDQVWLGFHVQPQDFSGQYKIKYDDDHLYILAAITDERLYKQSEDGLVNYWDDDCLEIFIDEDRSMGNHQYNHSAFAYHIGLDGKVADIGPDSLPHYYNDHIKSVKKSAGMKHIWELSMKIYDDSYVDGGTNSPVKLAKDKVMGFAIAYCDNDGSKEREHFIGSTVVEGDDKNRGWIDAGIFEELRLK